ncbi:hypothetical protein C8J57DRAFT_1530960 [Mycena rebaudengoi]|nr:hypothetical protein C8J57DRAFT_1530960 [Mycena rebaudengoi]
MTTTKISKTSNNVKSSRSLLSKNKGQRTVNRSLSHTTIKVAQAHYWESHREQLVEKAKFWMQQSRKDLAKLEAQTEEHTERIRCANKQFRMNQPPVAIPHCIRILAQQQQHFMSWFGLLQAPTAACQDRGHLFPGKVASLLWKESVVAAAPIMPPIHTVSLPGMLNVTLACGRPVADLWQTCGRYGMDARPIWQAQHGEK